MQKYAGLSYEAASRKAAALIEQAHKSGHWFLLLDDLLILRDLMRRELSLSAREIGWPVAPPPYDGGLAEAEAAALGHG